MPIDDELREAIHDAVVAHLQPLAIETQLLALLVELSEQEVSADRRAQRVELLQSEIDTSRMTERRAP
jgi:hypothetical protein